MRELSGNEDEVLFSPGDEFRGVAVGWLLPRLRLDPQQSPLELGETSMTITVAEDLFEDIDEHISIFGGDRHSETLAAFSDGPVGIIGGTLTLVGDWIHFYAHEIANRYTWVGPHPDRKRLVQYFLSTDARYWEPRHGQEYHLESSYFDAHDPADQQFLMNLASEADSVILNGTPVTQS